MDRKETVKILGEHFGAKPEYMGVPSFAYQIQTSEGIITIDKEGKIKNSKGVEVELQELLNGFQKEPIKEKNIDEGVTFTMDGHTGITLRNLINMISSKQTLIKKALDIKTDIVTKEFVEGVNNVRIVGIEDFKTAVLEIGEEKCPGISFNFEKETLEFKFTKGFENVEIADQFVEVLNESSKKFKHSSPKERQTDNEKYTFRTWLLRLGFIGDGYKQIRKELLGNLRGNSAFRNRKSCK
ncbi:virulence-related protein [Clostridium autoethanogenum]|uniref:Virulence-related protein n=1 Tax=Clostridium autoethanogenum TaxID=84023 RepID=A0A3M0SXX5_9CLOT|nr:virulence-related protein [Clostridium autoethanogenum]RMD03229.1 virulence-related protein [Clostridium autoethanogenum]